MFASEFMKMKQMTSRKTNILESASAIVNTIIESDVNIAETIFKYNRVLVSTLGANGNVYDDDVKSVMDESSKDVLNRLIEGMREVISLFEDLHQATDDHCDLILADNKLVIEKYQPLLKQLDTIKFSYTMPKYNLEKLTNAEILPRVLAWYTTLQSAWEAQTSLSEIQKLLNRGTDPTEMLNNIKRVVLGLPQTVNVDNFYSLVSNTLCDTKVVETKYFSDDVYAVLSQDVPLLRDIRVLHEIVKRELSAMMEYYDYMIRSDSARDQYYDSVRVRVFAQRKMVLCEALGLIAEIIQERLRLFNERSENYRKVVITTYEKATGADSTTLTESYNPMNDSVIGLLHNECNISGSIIL